MKKISFAILSLVVLSISACKKSSSSTSPTNSNFSFKNVNYNEVGTGTAWGGTTWNTSMNKLIGVVQNADGSQSANAYLYFTSRPTVSRTYKIGGITDSTVSIIFTSLTESTNYFVAGTGETVQVTINNGKITATTSKATLSTGGSDMNVLTGTWIEN